MGAGRPLSQLDDMFNLGELFCSQLMLHLGCSLWLRVYAPIHSFPFYLRDISRRFRRSTKCIWVFIFLPLCRQSRYGIVGMVR